MTQNLTTVAYLGPAATFSHAAAITRFGDQADYVPVRTIADVFEAVVSGQTQYGIVPVENSIEGSVTYTLDVFGQSGMLELLVYDEVMLPISHHLMTAPGSLAKLADIKLLYIHPQTLGQCREWLRANLPQAETQEVTSNARAAELARENAGTAAVAPLLAAEVYGLQVLASQLQDADFNQTRFFVIGQPGQNLPTVQHGTPVTALMLSIKDRVGALHAVTTVFTKYQLNMNRIESRPSKQKAWDYVFFVDFVGQPNQSAVAAALAELRDVAVWVRVLGYWWRT